MIRLPNLVYIKGVLVVEGRIRLPFVIPVRITAAIYYCDLSFIRNLKQSETLFVNSQYRHFSFERNTDLIFHSWQVVFKALSVFFVQFPVVTFGRRVSLLCSLFLAFEKSFFGRFRCFGRRAFVRSVGRRHFRLRILRFAVVRRLFYIIRRGID